MRQFLAVVQHAARDFAADECPTRAAALAYYSALSFGPLVLLLLWASARLGPAAQIGMHDQLAAFLGPAAGLALQAVMDNARAEPSAGSAAAIISTGTLVFTATSALTQLQQTLNRIWCVPQLSPREAAGEWLRRRALSLVLMLLLLVLGLLSVVASAAISLLLPDDVAWAQGAELVLSLTLLTFSVAGLFKVVPDATVHWRDVLPGALLTAVLFVAGKWGIGVYLGTSSVASSYGAAGSVLALLVWVFYSSVILLAGAELTYAWAQRDELPAS